MAVAYVPLDKAYLAAIWLETLLYGINICLFCSYVYIVRFRNTRKVTPVIFWIAVLMFCFSTVHVSLGFCRLIWGFIEYRDLPGGPGAYFSDVSSPPNVAKVTIHSINSILGDSIVVWRCWHVWSGDWRICVVPALLIVASAACGFTQAVVFAKASDIHSAFAHTLERWNGSVFTLSLVTNVVVTTLIAARIWYMNREANMVSSQFRYTKVLVLVIESAMIYSTAVAVEIILYFIGSNAFYIIYDPIAQLTGICPTMIIVMSVLRLTSSDLDSQAVREPRGRNNHVSSIKFKSRLGGNMPGLTTSDTGTTSSEFAIDDSARNVDRIEDDVKIPEHVHAL